MLLTPTVTPFLTPQGNDEYEFSNMWVTIDRPIGSLRYG